MQQEQDNYLEIKPIGHFSLNINELWQHRELIYFFIWRDLKVKYKQTFIGLLWLILQPLALITVFYFALHRSMQAQLSSMSYPMYILTGLVLWQYFASSVSHAAESMVSNANIIKKIYFPRLIIPLAAVGNACIDFLILFAIVCVVFLVRGEVHWKSIPLIMASFSITTFSALGIGSFLAAANLKYRDVRYALPFLIQLLLFTSTVLYPLTSQSPYWSFLKYVHPLNAALDGWRCAFSPEPANYLLLLTGLVYSCLLLGFGLYYFRKTEAFFADIA